MIEHPRCDTCRYVLPSYASPSGMRCGLQYFEGHPLWRKFRTMDFYPPVRPDNACESWTRAPTDADSDGAGGPHRPD